MKIKHSSIVSASSGRLGGSVSQRQKTGQVLRVQSVTSRRSRIAHSPGFRIPSDPFPTLHYLEDIFFKLNKKYRYLWEEFASSHPKTNALGDPIFLTGSKMFARCNYTQMIIHSQYQKRPRPENKSSIPFNLYTTAPLAGHPVTLHILSPYLQFIDGTQWRMFYPRPKTVSNTDHIRRVTFYTSRSFPVSFDYFNSISSLGVPFQPFGLYRFDFRAAPQGNQPGPWTSIDIQASGHP